MTKVSDFPTQTPANPDAPPLPWVNTVAFSTRDGEPLELVQLSVVLTWLMQSKRQHFAPAVLALHDALAGVDGLAMYAVSESGLARAVGDSDAFGLDSPQPGRRVISSGIGGGYAPVIPRLRLLDGVKPGISAALYVVRRERDRVGAPESSLAPGSLLSCLAMPCNQAAALWGAAAVAVVGTEPLTALAIKTEGKGKNKRGEWSHEAKALMQKAIADSKTGGTTRDAVAETFGLSRQTLSSAANRPVKGTRSRVSTAPELAQIVAMPSAKR